MKTKLTMQEKIKDMRIEKGLSLEQLSDATGISKSALAAYENDEEREIGSYNLATLAAYYGVSSDYILGLTEERTGNASAGGLRISDDAVAVLKNDGYNALLLSEVLTSSGFRRFMVDAEIYVDGVVSAQMHTYSKMLEMARTKFVDVHSPEEYNYQLETLKIMDIGEDDFFRQTLSADLMAILHEIRDAHQTDTDSNVDTSVVDKMTETFDEAFAMGGTPFQKLKFIFKKMLGSGSKNDEQKAERRLAETMSSGILEPVKTDKKSRRSKKQGQ